MQFTHIDIQVTINEESQSWKSPQASERISFSVPSELFDSTKISKLFPSLVKVAEERYKLEKSRVELEESVEAE